MMAGSLASAVSGTANAKSTVALANMFRRIFVFIRCLWFVCPFTEVLQEIRRDITRKVWIFFDFIFCSGWIVDCINCNPVPRGNQEPSSRGALEQRPHFG